MNIDILTYYPATIVVSTEGENKFRVRPRMRTRHAAEKNHANNCTTTNKRTLEADVLAGPHSHFKQILTLPVGVDSYVRYLNKLTWPRAETKKTNASNS